MEEAQHIGQTLSSSKFGLPCYKTFWMGTEPRPNYAQEQNQSLAHLAANSNEHPVETWIRLQLESDGKGFFHVRFVNEDLSVLPNYMGADWVVPGVGDAGAHVSMIMDAGWTSFFISHWHRDTGTYSIEETIHMLTSKQNQVLRLSDRGTLAVGKKSRHKHSRHQSRRGASTKASVRLPRRGSTAYSASGRLSPDLG
jgi:N-acyl-D-aspartate/D-glutamate deacylase